MTAGVWMVLIPLALLAWRVAMHFADVRRIEAVARSRGWSEVQVSWQPLAPGWAGNDGGRHYQVFYLDDSGAPGEAFATTAMFADVYWREATER